MNSPLVLVAGHAPDLRERVAASLCDSGCSVLEMDCKTIATEARRLRPDVIVVDTAGVDGVQALRRLTQDETVGDIPVIALTVTGDTELVSLGAHDVVRLPYDDAELLARVNAAARARALWLQVRRGNDARERFAGTVGHDLKSPLTILAGVSQTLAARWDSLDEANRARLLGAMSTAANRASRMVSDLVALAQASGTRALEPASVDAERVVRRVLEEAGLGGSVTLDGHWSAVEMEAGHFGLVVSNLVENADYWGRSPDGSLRLTISAIPRDSTVEIVFEDRGPGIPPADVAGLFEPFRKSSRAESHPDSNGVGLALVRRIVERAGGAVSVGPAEPEGTAVRVTLRAASPTIR